MGTLRLSFIFEASSIVSLRRIVFGDVPGTRGFAGGRDLRRGMQRDRSPYADICVQVPWESSGFATVGQILSCYHWKSLRSESDVTDV